MNVKICYSVHPWLPYSNHLVTSCHPCRGAKWGLRSIVFSILWRFICEEGRVLQITIMSLVVGNKGVVNLVNKGVASLMKRLNFPFGGSV